MKKIKWIIILVCLCCGCAQWFPENCKDTSKSVYSAAVRKYGKDNVQKWLMENHDKLEYTYHIQIKIRPDGKTWMWADCPTRRVYLDTYHEKGCKPLKRLK